MSKNTCPRCGGGIPNDAQRGEYPGAVSRWTRSSEDELIYVCSQCGQDEAMIQFGAYLNKEDQGEAVHPLHGVKPWVHLPDGYVHDSAPTGT